MAEFRQRGQVPEDMDKSIGTVLSYIHFAIPDVPVSGPPLRALARRRRRPPQPPPRRALRRIVSCLPVKDAARTAALSTRWRKVWRSTSLVLVDAEHLPVGMSDSDTCAAREDAHAVTSPPASWTSTRACS
ncbi:hypothetical protein OsI_25018 [Oryza sativa Indica Group]|uniref:F-box domain-containing protein n=2 Tax=Oryza sativa TaxID=4530 RepID=B9FVN4_ORYSJ|nr:hypothetical protein OsI_25018 [Oryza sativa Indica Group]EEE66621.1 hypothetical protein OsJ_23207 [Oryza sativa Japonica Group]